MSIYKVFFQVICYLLLALAAGCSRNLKSMSSAVEQKTFTAIYTSEPVKVDGILDEAIWKNCPSYDLHLSKEGNSSDSIKEPGRVRFAWDKKYFYLAAHFEDSDIVAEGKEDQLHHYRYGDVCELFLKPSDEDYSWEFHVTPLNKKTTFFFPSMSYLGLPSCFENYRMDIVVAAVNVGQVNNWHDRDKLWTAEMAVPIKELEALGAKFGPGQSWRILIGRYNYSRYLQDRELSMTPQLSSLDFHLLDEYAHLNLVRQ